MTLADVIFAIPIPSIPPTLPSIFYISVVVAVLGVAVLAIASTEHGCQSSRPDVGRSLISVQPSIISGFRTLSNQSLRVTRSKKYPIYVRPLLVMLPCFVPFSCFPINGGYVGHRARPGFSIETASLGFAMIRVDSLGACRAAMTREWIVMYRICWVAYASNGNDDRASYGR